MNLTLESIKLKLDSFDVSDYTELNTLKSDVVMSDINDKTKCIQIVNIKLKELETIIKVNKSKKIQEEKEKHKELQSQKEINRKELYNKALEIKQNKADYESEKLEEMRETFKDWFAEDNIQIFKKIQSAKVLFIFVENNYFEGEKDLKSLEMDLQMKYFKRYNETLSFENGDNYISLINDILIPCELVSSLQGLNFEPTAKTLIEFEGKQYYNIFIPTKLELKLRKTIIKPIKKSLIELRTEFKFQNVDRIIRFLSGDERIFYEDNLELINEIKKTNSSELLEMFDSHKDLHFLKTFKTTDINQLKIIFENKLSEISNNSVLVNMYDTQTTYFYNWLAWIYQNPLEKIPTGIAIISTQGVGKDLFKDIILNPLFSPDCVKSLDQNKLSEKFNKWLLGARIIVAQELEMTNKSQAMFKSIKDIMTNPIVSIRAMNSDTINAINYSSWLFFSNHRNCLKLDKEDRRFTIYEQNLKLSPYTIHKLYSKGYISVNNLPKEVYTEVEELGKCLLSLNTSYSKIKVPLDTDIKSEMLSFSKTDVDRFVDYINEFGCVVEMYEYFISREIHYFNKNSLSSCLRKNIFSKTEYYTFITKETLFMFFQLWKKENSITGNRDLHSFTTYLKSEYKLKHAPDKVFRCDIYKSSKRVFKLRDFTSIGNVMESKQ